jgi:hypothetical protein
MIPPCTAALRIRPWLSDHDHGKYMSGRRWQQHEIGILDDADLPVADQSIAHALAERAGPGVKLRICCTTRTHRQVRKASSAQTVVARRWRVHKALASYASLLGKGEVEIRLHHGAVYNSIYYADDQMLVSQRVGDSWPWS